MTEAEKERAAIVKLLRVYDRAEIDPIDHRAFGIIADAIERLDHHKGTPNDVD